MCKFFEHGGCSRGDKCHFAHGKVDLQSRPNLHKTQLCIAFERKGTCRDGPACKYAHGQRELQASLREACAARRPCPSSPWTATAEAVARPEVAVASLFNAKPVKQDHMIKQLKEDDTWSVPTTDAGLEDLESWRDLSRQTSESSSLRGADPNEEVVDSDYNSQHLTPDTRSEISEDAPSLVNQQSMNVVTEELPEALDTKLWRTRMCKYALQGFCTKGARCDFAHDNTTLKRRPNLSRTSLCIAFDKSGKCRKGDACKYAHGGAALHQSVPLHRGDSQVTEESFSNKETPCVRATEDSTTHPLERHNVITYEANSLVVCVKNTFLHIRREVSAVRRRSVSCHN
jgi:hypothetical protein